MIAAPLLPDRCRTKPREEVAIFLYVDACGWVVELVGCHGIFANARGIFRGSKRSHSML